MYFPTLMRNIEEVSGLIRAKEVQVHCLTFTNIFFLYVENEQLGHQQNGNITSR